MAFDLGSVRAKMGLDEGNFVRGMLNAEASAEVFGQSVVQFVNNPLLGTIRIMKDAVSGFAGLVAETANYNREVAQWAERTGASTELLSGLAFAARKVGVEIEDIGDTVAEVGVKARDSLGSEDLKRTFERLGVAVLDSNGQLRNAQDLFLDVADGLQSVTNETERVAIADELLSDAGKRLLPILSQGRDGIADIVKEAKRYGLVVSQNAAEASRQMADDVDDMTASLEGIKRSGATSFMEGFRDAMGESETGVSALAEQIRTQLNPVMEDLGRFAGGVLSSDWFRDTIEGAQAVGDALKFINIQLDDIERKTRPRNGPESWYENISFWDAPISWATYNAGKLLYWLTIPDDSTEATRERILEYKRQQEARRQSAEMGSVGGS